MKPELHYLVLSAALTAVLWIPYVLNRAAVWGLAATVGYPAEKKPLAPWAERLRSAHANAVENLVVFAPLVLAAQALDVSNPLTVLACTLYFWSRVVHLLAYTFALPWVRTLAFVGGFVGQAMLAWQLLG